MQVDGYTPLVLADGRRRRKVCIVGFAGSTRDAFPKDDPDLELWGMNRLHDIVDPAPFTRWFQLHPRDVWDTPKRAKEVALYRQSPIPVYLHQHYDDIPASVPFPKATIEQVFNKFLPQLPGGGDRLNGDSYQATSVTWMIALALLEGFEEIQIYGVDMVTDEEYSYQRPSCEWWLGLAAGLGVKTVLPADSALCTQEWLYGYQMRPPAEGVLSKTVLLGRRKATAAERDQAIAASNFHAGRLAEIDQLLSIQKHAGRGGKTGIKASLIAGQMAETQAAGAPVKG